MFPSHLLGQLVGSELGSLLVPRRVLEREMSQCSHWVGLMLEVLGEGREVFHGPCHSHYLPVVVALGEAPKVEDQGPTEIELGISQ